MNTFYFILETCFVCCIRFVVSCFTWFLTPPPPETFRPALKRSVDTWSATVNQRRARKAQRKAAASGDRFAFA